MTEEQVTARPTRGGEQQRRGDVRQRVGLVRPDVDELRRTAARGARPARHVRRGPGVDRRHRAATPRREVPGGQVVLLHGVHLTIVAPGGRTVPA